MGMSLFTKSNVVFVIPFFLLRKIDVTPRQLWGLIFLFSFGGIAILVSIARIVALVVSATTTQVALWTALECSIGIIVACCPSLFLLFRRRGPPDLGTSALDGSPSRDGTHHSKNATKSNQEHSVRCDEDTEITTESTDFELVEVSNGRYIFKNVDFEILSETHSNRGQTARVRTENWEHLGK
jgi:hypothetical protein